MKDIKVAAKYCGGCNPYYDRKQAAGIIAVRLDVKLEPYREESIPDIALIICGCKSECIDISKYKSRYRTIVINDIKDIDEIVRIIQESIPD